MKKIIFFISIIIVLFSYVNVLAGNCGIECGAEVNARNVCISGKVMNVTERVPVTLRVGDIDELVYIGQQMSASDGTFSFDFAMPDTASSGSYNYVVGTDIVAGPYVGVFEYVTDSHIACVLKVTGQNVNIRGRITNATESNPVTLRVGSIDSILYIGQTMSTDNGWFNFDFGVPDTVSSGSYEYRISTNTEVESYSGVLPYTTENRIACKTKIIDRKVSISGCVVNAVGINKLTIVVGDTDNEIYEEVLTTQDDHTFLVEFELPDTLPGGKYVFTIESEADVDMYTGILDYVPTTKPVSYVKCSHTIKGQSINIFGQIMNTEGANQLFLVVGNKDDIIYSQQALSSEDGKFNFNFDMLSNVEPGNYTFTIDTDIDTATYIGILEYNALIERQVAVADITVAISSYVPTVIGKISCVSGKELVFSVVNANNNTTIIQDAITDEDGLFNLSHSLPSLLTGKDYSVIISCSDGEKKLFDITAAIESSVVVMKISGGIQIDDSVKLMVSAKSTNSDLINKSIIFTSDSDRTWSATIPNLVANLSCNVTLKAFEMVQVQEEENKSVGDKKSYSIIGDINSLSRIVVNAQNVSNVNNKVFSIKYESLKLKLVDICGFTVKKEASIGPIIGTNIEILSLTAGQISFKINSTGEQDRTLSGPLNILVFRKLDEEDTTIYLGMDETQ